MAATQDEEPGFETDVNEQPDSNKGPGDSVEDKHPVEKQNSHDIEQAQK
ncbi:hypothetical protein IFR23_17420 [Sphingomonas sp. CFBP 13603]|nr:hypothetical protein [Sphingomonas sp. CFBP 13603]MBE2993781.1 hypothetical protein [Sphingomonas sp. CFBP 13603]